MTENGPVVLASDHAALEMRAALKAHLEKRGCDVVDLGPNGTESVDYPDFAGLMAETIEQGRASRGVLLCGTGLGMSIAVNRSRAVRGALCHDVSTARMARMHNDANVLVVGARVTGALTAVDMLDVFLDTDFEGGRHQRRIDKIS